MIFCDIGTLIRALTYGLFRQRFSVRRWSYIAVFSLLYFVVFSIVVMGRMIDHVLFFRYHWQQIEKPVFIVANPRSGTTFMHNLMRADTGRFTSFRLYQTLLPAVCFYRFFAGLRWIDRHTGQVLSRLMVRLDKWLFKGWKDIHPTGLSRPEEDEGLFMLTLLSPGLYFLFPDFKRLGHLAFDYELPKWKKTLLMRYYKDCLKRHVYATGGNRTLLNKNVLFSGRLQMLIETFPDARIVNLVRNPCRAVPSMIDMWHSAWRAHSPEIAKDSPECKDLAEIGMGYYQYTMRAKAEFPKDQFFPLRYDDLVKAPKETVERVYAHFSMDVSDEFAAKLTEMERESRRYGSRHHYTLEQYGLSKDYVRNRLGSVFETYGFEV